MTTRTLSSSQPWAAIDIGSNSFRLELARLSGDRYQRISYIKESVRLGAGLDANGMLTEAAMERGLACLKGFGAQLAGIAPERIFDVITASAGNSWMFGNRAPHVVAGDYTPHSAIDIWLKDLGIVLDVARGSKFSAPMAATAMQQFAAASGSGLGREDDAAVAKVYARNCGIKLPGDA